MCCAYWVPLRWELLLAQAYLCNQVSCHVVWVLCHLFGGFCTNDFHRPLTIYSGFFLYIRQLTLASRANDMTFVTRGIHVTSLNYGFATCKISGINFSMVPGRRFWFECLLIALGSCASMYSSFKCGNVVMLTDKILFCVMTRRVHSFEFDCSKNVLACCVY